MKIIYLKSTASTQTYLKELISKSKEKTPLAVVADMQTSGVGSRDNLWKGLSGNLFLSFAISIKDLPKDLKLESASIYFSQILKNILQEKGSKVWLKWPNDFYINDKKIGGIITNIVDGNIICGVGINLRHSPQEFTILDIEISRDELVQIYTNKIKKNLSWKQIFSKYKLNFYLNQKYYTHNNNFRISLKNAELQDDGSVLINGERIYSLR